jgi:hypothetical protein
MEGPVLRLQARTRRKARDSIAEIDRALPGASGERARYLMLSRRMLSEWAASRPRGRSGAVEHLRRFIAICRELEARRPG